jgi:hypothetical protein
MTSLALLGAILLAQVAPELPLTATLSDGSSSIGMLLALNDKELTLTVDSRPRRIPVDQILTLETNLLVRDEPTPAAVLLRGQGIVRVQRITTDDRTALLELPGQDPWTLPLTSLVGIVWETTDRAGLLARYRRMAVAADRDRLVAVRGNDRATLEGTVGPISDTQVIFTLDRDPIEVKRDRVREITFSLPTADVKPAVTLTDSRGNLWPADQVTATPSHWISQSATLGTRQWPLADIVRVDLSSQKLTYLSDLEPLLVEQTAYFDQAWPYQRDKNFAGAPLTLMGPNQPPRVYPKGLAIHSKTLLVYPLAPDDRRFRSDVAIDPNITGGSARVLLSVNDTTLWEKEIASGDIPMSIDLPLPATTGPRRLTLLVDFGKRGDVGDHVILGDARLVK